MSDHSHFLDRGLAMTTPHPLGERIVRAEGCWMETESGERLFDMVSGIGVSSLGHGHPAIRRALQEQLDRHLHVMVYGEYAQEAQDRAASSLLSSLEGTGLDAVYFVNSGTEAIEGAMKLVRRATGRTEILAVEGGYHGATFGALSLSTPSHRRNAFMPLLPDVSHVPFGSAAALDRITERTAAVFVETVQGDAGIRPVPADHLHALRKRCSDVGVLLVLDEIQCGLGRTGHVHAFQRVGVVPDVLVLGKALGGGMPIGAFVAGRECMSSLREHPKLGHITTFGGHPMACAAAAAFLQELQGLDWERIRSTGARWKQALSAHPAVVEVRGHGHFLGVDLDGPDRVSALVAAARKRGVVLFWFLSRPQGFRLAPPLNASADELDQALQWLLESLDEVQ
ncbi:MAG: aspartate aminotransferase family protein [Flavobacteriales bacterium]